MLEFVIYILYYLQANRSQWHQSFFQLHSWQKGNKLDTGKTCFSMRIQLRDQLIIGLLMVLGMLNCGGSRVEKQFAEFITTHVAKIEPLMKDWNLSYWQASLTGSKEDFDRAAEYELKIRTIYSDTTDFIYLKGLKQAQSIRDPLLKRQLDVLYHAYLGNQIPVDLLKKIVAQKNAVENKFTVFRGKIGNRVVTDNEISDILRYETDSAKRRDAWLASKQVGQVVASDIIELVKLRNEAARKLGFENFYLMSLELSEQQLDQLTKIFDELWALTEQPFRRLKADLDSVLARNYGIEPQELMPWHYHDPFFQEGPMVDAVNLDRYYEAQDVRALAEKFFASIDLPVDDILARSDLYERPGKNPHAFCTSIDREEDVRVLANIKNNKKWMETMLHELGHAVYDKYIDKQLPFLLREPAHIFATEAIAMLFGRLSRNGYWLRDMIALPDEVAEQIASSATRSLRLRQLIFARWCQVMFRFEQALYQDPDQDLNSLWWELVEKYQLVRKPAGRNAPDWAAKIHFTIAPVYYHNYMLGELLASQFHNYLVTQVLKFKPNQPVSYVNRPVIGEYLRRFVFFLGARYPWNEMVVRTTGAPLSPSYFVDQFIAE